MDIVDMTMLNSKQKGQAARILTDSLPEGWPTLADAQGELRKRLIPGNTMLAALDDAGDVLGWGGVLAPTYDGRVFELHPLCVREDARGKGVARAIVAALEAAARERGGLTIYLGADDEREGGETSLANVDLYDDLPGRLASFDPGGHQTAFYLKVGYTIVGVVPDANGPGRPDIMLAKRL